MIGVISGTFEEPEQLEHPEKPEQLVSRCHGNPIFSYASPPLCFPWKAELPERELNKK